MALDNCISLPLRVGPQLARACRACTNAIPGDPESTDYFTLVDNVNQHVLTQLTHCISGDAYLLAFVRGSIVQGRLEIAGGLWPRIVELLDLDEVLEDLERAYGTLALDDAVSMIKREALRLCLDDRGRLGASKLLLRLKKPDGKLFAPDNYVAIETFIREVSTLAQNCDQTLQDVIAHADLGEARSAVREQFRWLLIRFEFHSLVDHIDAHFDDIIKIHRDAASLHPALPIAEAAVSKIADRLDIKSDIAQQITVLLRLAWVCRLNQPEDFSDFSIKATVLVPQDDTSQSGPQEQAQETLRAIDSVLRETILKHPGLQRFHGIYPDVRIGTKGYVMSLPRELFEVFLHLDPGKKQLDFTTRYRIGPAYFQRYLISGFGEDERSSLLDMRDRDRRNSHLASMIDRVIYIGSKAKGDCVKTKERRPMNISPDTVRELLENVLLHRDRSDLETFSGIVNKADKENLFDKIRGLWTVK